MADEILNNAAIEATDLDQSEVDAFNELTILKQRATLMGVKFSNNIGIEALRAKVKAAQEEPVANAGAAPDLIDPAVPVATRKLTEREQMYQECMKLIRVRITNLDPKKKDLPGEIFTVGNEVIGTVTKYIPYGEVTDEGYHLPMIIYNNLKERKFLDLRTYRDKANNNRIKVEQRWATEFAFEVLPQLTPEEIERLRIAQLQAGNSGNN